MGDQNQLCLVSLSSYVWNWYVMKMLAFAGNDYSELSLYVSFGLENYVGGKAACGFFVHLCLELLCNEDNLWASSLELIIGNCVCVCVSFAIGLENSVREMRAIRISCVWCLCPVMFEIGM